ncbi:MAG: hypothetical protein AAFP22_09780, partial [Planctomycetota bacterium]
LVLSFSLGAAAAGGALAYLVAETRNRRERVALAREMTRQVRARYEAGQRAASRGGAEREREHEGGHRHTADFGSGHPSAQAEVENRLGSFGDRRGAPADGPPDLEFLS